MKNEKGKQGTMRKTYNQCDLKKIKDNAPSDIEFNMSYRKSEDSVFSKSKGNVNFAVLAALHLVEQTYSLGLELLSAVSEVYIDDNGPGFYEIYLSQSKLPKHIDNILLGHVYEEEFVIDIVETNKDGDVESGETISGVLKQVS